MVAAAAVAVALRALLLLPVQKLVDMRDASGVDWLRPRLSSALTVECVLVACRHEY